MKVKQWSNPSLHSRARRWGGATAAIGITVVGAITATLITAPAASADRWIGPYIVGGAIEGEYDAAGGWNTFGNPTTPESDASRYGKFQVFEKNNSIYWHQNTGAHQVGGRIRDKWRDLNWENGVLQYPTTRERNAVNGKYNNFEGGSIYFSPSTDAHNIQGLIRDKWYATGAETGSMGFPTTDEVNLAKDNGRLNHFEKGSIYWSSASGARSIHGEMRNNWAVNGWENGVLGYPTSDEYMDRGIIRQDFQGGARWFTPITIPILPEEVEPDPTILRGGQESTPANESSLEAEITESAIAEPSTPTSDTAEPSTSNVVVPSTPTSDTAEPSTSNVVVPSTPTSDTAEPSTSNVVVPSTSNVVIPTAAEGSEETAGDPALPPTGNPMVPSCAPTPPSADGTSGQSDCVPGDIAAQLEARGIFGGWCLFGRNGEPGGACRGASWSVPVARCIGAIAAAVALNYLAVNKIKEVKSFVNHVGGARNMATKLLSLSSNPAARTAYMKEAAIVTSETVAAFFSIDIVLQNC